MYELVLVSQSPRRQQLLADAGYLFRVDPVKISEIIEENVNLTYAITRIAQTKAEAYVNSHKQLKLQNILLLSADTMVCMGGRALGKPQNSTEAESFLCQLSGQVHIVTTGLCFYNFKNGEQVLAHDSTEVQFRKLSRDEILEYIASGEPLDKAGAYALQGEGRKFVEKITGSYSNVVGLPLEKVEEILKQKGWNVDRREHT